MKPTIINILFGFSLLFGKFFSKEPLLKVFLKKSIKLKDEGWNKLKYKMDRIFFLFSNIK